MRALEDALAIAQAAESTQPHPLLMIEPEPDIEIDINVTEDDEVAAADSLAGTFGTLHIDEKERTERFFGASGGSEVRQPTSC